MGTINNAYLSKVHMIITELDDKIKLGINLQKWVHKRLGLISWLYRTFFRRDEKNFSSTETWGQIGALIHLLSHMGAAFIIYKGGEALAVSQELDWCINLVHKILNWSRKNKK